MALLRPTRTQITLLAVSPLPTLGVGLVWVPAVAVIGAGLQAFLVLPSARVALRSGANLSGVAVGTWVLLIVGNVLWFTYDVGIGFPLSGLVGMLSALTALVVIVRTLAYRRSLLNFVPSGTDPQGILE